MIAPSRGAACCAPTRNSAQARPVVGDQDGIRRIRRVIFYAGGLASDELVEVHLAFEAGYILRGVIGDAGNGVAVGDQLTRIQAGERPGPRTEEAFAFFTGLGRVRDERGGLALRDAPDLIQMQA